FRSVPDPASVARFALLGWTRAGSTWWRSIARLRAPPIPRPHRAHQLQAQRRDDTPVPAGRRLRHAQRAKDRFLDGVDGRDEDRVDGIGLDRQAAEAARRLAGAVAGRERDQELAAAVAAR